MDRGIGREEKEGMKRKEKNKKEEVQREMKDRREGNENGKQVKREETNEYETKGRKRPFSYLNFEKRETKKEK